MPLVNLPSSTTGAFNASAHRIRTCLSDTTARSRSRPAYLLDDVAFATDDLPQVSEAVRLRRQSISVARRSLGGSRFGGSAGSAMNEHGEAQTFSWALAAASSRSQGERLAT